MDFDKSWNLVSQVAYLSIGEKENLYLLYKILFLCGVDVWTPLTFGRVPEDF